MRGGKRLRGSKFRRYQRRRTDFPGQPNGKEKETGKEKGKMKGKGKEKENLVRGLRRS